MMKRFARPARRPFAKLALLASAIALASCARLAGPVQPGVARSSNITAITNVTVVDVETGARTPRSTILIEDETIAAVGPSVRIPARARRINGGGRFVIPGLWDMHSHHQGSGVESLRLFVGNGVVGTRDMASDADFILPLRERIAKGEIVGPRIIAAGPMLDNPPADFPWRRRVTTADEARSGVRDLKAKGVDLIKVHDHTPRDAFFAILDEAKKNGLPVAGHVPMAVNMDEAYASGMQSIEHFANGRIFGSCLKAMTYVPAGCTDQFKRVAASGIVQDPTMIFFVTFPDLLDGKPIPHAEYASQPVIENTMVNVNMTRENVPESNRVGMRTFFDIWVRAVVDMKRAGVKFVAGCDLMVPGFCLHDELGLFAKSGLTPLEVLQTATINPARMLGREARSGTIAVGKDADLVLLDRDPLLAVANLRQPAAVMVAGRLIMGEALAAMRQPMRPASN